ncbi:MAG TPA: serpin family protein [Candidatus Gallacutalibacter stercoravium]|nr:serpin family protein [Candidatus Gallacutalibacter stercoravium]
MKFCRKAQIALLLCLIMLLPVGLSLAGCSSGQQTPPKDIPPDQKSVDLMKNIEAHAEHTGVDLRGERADPLINFSMCLMQHSLDQEKNTLISPLSVLYCLAMAANGTEGETLSQMESVFGTSLEQLNDYLYAYRWKIPSQEPVKLQLANAIWFKNGDDLIIKDSFLQTNAAWYGADAYKAPFNDYTLQEINDWVHEKTDGTIDSIIDEIPPDALMYLVNALAFDAEWSDIYKENQIDKGLFTSQNGEQREVYMMYSREYCYLQDEQAVGFLKPYADNQYAFVALLPNEGVSVNDYVASLDGRHLKELLQNASDDYMVTATLPKFKSEYRTDLANALSAMGMTDAFHSERANFSAMGSWKSESLYISRVLHKAFLSVDERGTKAGAATAAELKPGSAGPDPEKIKTVRLDRPFFYMVVDTKTFLPLFMGTVLDLEPC